VKLTWTILLRRSPLALEHLFDILLQAFVLLAYDGGVLVQGYDQTPDRSEGEEKSRHLAEASQVVLAVEDPIALDLAF
jgi:hypothetical protein